MIDVLRIAVSKDDLLKLSSHERALFLLLGNASNQVNALWKLIVISTNRTPDDPVNQRISAAQTQIFVRLIIGVLREAWGLVDKRFLGSVVGREFEPLLGEGARTALTNLKKRFGSSNMLAVIRNNFAFHHPDVDDMEAAFQQAVASSESEDADWGIYMTRTYLNSFFFVSDFVVAHGMANAVGETDLIEGHRKLLGELAPIANDLTEFTYGFTAAIFRKHFGKELSGSIAARICDAPNTDDVWLPFFTATPGVSETLMD